MAAGDTLVIEGAGLNLTLNVEDLKAREQVTIETTNVDSNGDVADVTGSGISLYTLLEDNGIDPQDLTSMTFTASDGYIHDDTAGNPRCARSIPSV